MDDFNKDEFDEFKNFNRELLNKLFNDRMNDIEFKEKFMGIVGGYQRDFQNIINLLNGIQTDQLNFENDKNLFNDQFFKTPTSFLNGLDFTSVNDEDGWNSQHWVTPDGSTHISSFTKTITPEEFYQKDKKQKDKHKIPTDVFIKMLETKMEEVLLTDTSEGYREAATLLETINSLKKGEKIKKNKKNT